MENENGKHIYDINFFFCPTNCPIHPHIPDDTRAQRKKLFKLTLGFSFHSSATIEKLLLMKSVRKKVGEEWKYLNIKQTKKNMRSWVVKVYKTMNCFILFLLCYVLFSASAQFPPAAIFSFHIQAILRRGAVVLYLVDSFVSIFKKLRYEKMYNRVFKLRQIHKFRSMKD